MKQSEREKERGASRKGQEEREHASTNDKPLVRSSLIKIRFEVASRVSHCGTCLSTGCCQRASLRGKLGQTCSLALRGAAASAALMLPSQFWRLSVSRVAKKEFNIKANSAARSIGNNVNSLRMRVECGSPIRLGVSFRILSMLPLMYSARLSASHVQHYIVFFLTPNSRTRYKCDTCRFHACQDFPALHFQGHVFLDGWTDLFVAQLHSHFLLAGVRQL